MALQIVGNKKYSILVAYVITKMVTWYTVETGDTVASSLNTLWMGDADLRLYITTVQDG